jgi:hypothetical protein
MSTYKEFSQLFESIVTEVSTGMAQFSDPNAQELLKTLHRTKTLGHDVQYEKIPRISWASLKDNPDQWFILKGENGWAAIVLPSKRSAYEIFTANGIPNPENSELVTLTKAGTATDGNTLLKNTIGKPIEFYTVNSRYSKQLSGERASAKAKANPYENKASIGYLIKRFMPIFTKLLTTAKADVKGVISTMVKNDVSRDKINNKLYKINSIEQSLDRLKEGTIDEYLTDAVNKAVVFAARYYYPQETGDLTANYYRGHTSFQQANSDGVKHVLSDISEGDTTKLSGVLAYLKKVLV